MRPTILPTSWQPDTGLLKRIRSGVSAEKSFTRTHLDSAFALLRTNHAIPLRFAPGMVKRAIKAAVASIRHTGKWLPNLVEQMLYDQVTVYRFQKGIIPERLYKQYQHAASVYIREHMGWHSLTDGTLNFKQEAVFEAAQDAFYENLRQPSFALRSALTTYLISIVKHLIYASGRTASPFQLPSFRSGKTTAFDSMAVQESFVLPATVRFYEQAHRLIASQLSEMSTTCQQLIYGYHGIDPWRVSAVASQPDVSGPLTEAEFTELFSVAIDGSISPPTLKQLAGTLQLSQKKISDRRLHCLHKLVRGVLPELAADPSLTIPDEYRDLFQARLAQKRQQSR